MSNNAALVRDMIKTRLWTCCRANKYESKPVVIYAELARDLGIQINDDEEVVIDYKIRQTGEHKAVITDRKMWITRPLPVRDDFFEGLPKEE
jgi:hypothetical protein